MSHAVKKMQKKTHTHKKPLRWKDIHVCIYSNLTNFIMNLK